MVEPARPESRGAAWRPSGWDVLVAAAAAGLSLWVLARGGAGGGYRAADPPAFLLTGIGAASLAWGRVRPLPAVVVASLAGTALGVRDYHVDVLPFVVAVLLFASGSYLARRTATWSLAFACAAFAVTALSHPADLGPAAVVQSYLIFAISWLLGRLTRSRRLALLDLVSAAEARAAAERALAQAERDRAMLARVEERLRIARELHDVLAHAISVISVQATVGEHLTGSTPGPARQALATIGQVARSSMQEVRQLVTLLRDDSTPEASAEALYEPAHDLTDLDDLVATFAAAGLAVQTETIGTPQPLSASAQLCTYRIVQEALTNTLKHAGTRTARLLLSFGPEALQVSVLDDGRGTAADGPGGTGHGVIGMRERTLLLGGDFTAGPGPAGGFAVRATIPYTTT